MVTTYEQKLQKYSRGKTTRSSEEIQKPIETNIKYQIPADLVEKKPVIFIHRNISLRSHDELEKYSKKAEFIGIEK